jgi:hypothetical protein
LVDFSREFGEGLPAPHCGRQRLTFATHGLDGIRSQFAAALRVFVITK